MKRLFSKSIIISLFSTLFQYYAFSIYAFSSVILAPVFFGENGVQTTKTFGLITLSIPLVLKPLGSVLFGHIGDKHGRKRALIYSLTTITLATTAIGLIPPHSSIGWVSSLLLLFCLFTQGLSLAGQYTGAIIFIQEHMDKKHAAFACGIVGCIGVFGVLLGTGTSFLFHHFDLVNWEWRLPFLLAFVLGSTLLYFTRYVQETPIFIEKQEEALHKKIPLLEIMLSHQKVMFAALFLSSISVSMFYIATAYLPNFYNDMGGAGGPIDPLQLACIAQIFNILFVFIFGYTADKWGKEKQIKIGSFFIMILPIFFFTLMTYNNSYLMLIMGLALFTFLSSLFVGAAPAYLSEKFPIIGKYSGLGLGISMGEGLFGGLSPLICVGFEQMFDSKIAPAFYISCLGLLSLFGLFISLKKSERQNVSYKYSSL